MTNGQTKFQVGQKVLIKGLPESSPDCRKYENTEATIVEQISENLYLLWLFDGNKELYLDIYMHLINEVEPEIHKCTCDIMVIMRAGCQCKWV